MDSSIGGINKFGLNYTPISSYNKMLEGTLEQFGSAANSNESTSQFDGILNNQMASIENQNFTNPISGGVSMTIDDINKISSVEKTQGSESVELINSIGKGFSNSINSLNNMQVKAEKAIETLASGGDISVHDVTIASQKARLSMQMGLQLRNKIMSAYNELYQLKF